jgi:hypothetical protein
MIKKILMLTSVCAWAFMILTGCVYMPRYKMDGVVPFDYYQTVQNEGERLVFLAPVLAPNHYAGELFIITNPEDIQKAVDKLGNRDTASIREISNTLKEFSPVLIESLATTPGSGQTQGDGIGVFSLPPMVDKFFYVYIRYKTEQFAGYNKSILDYTTDVWYDILSLPPGSDDVFIGFSEDEDGFVISANANPVQMKAAYDATTGIYGVHFSLKKKQMGFIPIGIKERLPLLEEKRKAEALAAGATLSVYSGYLTYRQETYEYEQSEFIPEQSHWEEGQTIEHYSGLIKVGESRTQGRRVVDSEAHIETKTKTNTVNVPVRHELAFEIYKGNVKVLSGRTPKEITGIVVGEEYTLRWVSPDNGRMESRFTMGLNFLGYPDSRSKYIK